MAKSTTVIVWDEAWADRIEAVVEHVERNLYITTRHKKRPPLGDGGGCDRQNAIIDVTLPGRPTGGTFVMNWTVNGVTTPITFDWDSSAATFKTQLATHSEILSTDLTVTVGPLPNATMRIEFIDTLANQDIAIPTADWTNLTGGSGVGVNCALAQKGHS